MTQFQKLEVMLRKHGFIIGVVTIDDEKLIDALLKDIREMFDEEARNAA